MAHSAPSLIGSSAPEALKTHAGGAYSRPYGATTVAGRDGSRQPSENEFAGARYQGRYVAEVTAKMFG